MSGSEPTAETPDAGSARVLGAPRNATKASVSFVPDAGAGHVRKEMPPGGGLLGALGRVLLAREARMLARLQHLDCVPRLRGSGARFLETEYVAGETVSARRARGVTADEAARIDAALARLHAAGFAHGDVGRRDVLLADDGRVVFFDLATAIGPGAPPLVWRLLLPLARRHDRRRVATFVGRAQRRADDRTARLAARAAGGETQP